MSAVISDPDARRRILAGTASMAAVGGAVGLNVAILRNLQPIARHTLTMSANWTLCSLFFFTTREALLAEQRSRNHTLHLRMSQTRSSDEMFSSVIAGGLTGGMLAFISRGRRQSAITGAAFFAAVAAAGQFAYTKANQRRQQMIISRMHSGSVSEPQMPENKQDEEEEKQQQSTSIVSRLRRAVAVDPITLLPDWFPFRRIPSEEYREILELRREEVLFELTRVRQVLADMDQREELLVKNLQLERDLS